MLIIQLIPVRNQNKTIVYVELVTEILADKCVYK